MTIGSQSYLPSLHLIRSMAHQASRELGSAAHRGTTARPTVQQINHTLERLASIVRLMDDVVLPALDLPAIPHASDVEKRIVGKLVADLLAAGNTITVNDGEDETLVGSVDAAAIFAALSSTDEDYVIVNSNQNGRYGWVRLVWGNDVDVLSDYTTNLEAIVGPVNALANELEG